MTNIEPVHPGATVLELLDYHDYSLRYASEKSGIDEATIIRILAGQQRIDHEIADGLEKLFDGCPARFFINLQDIYDEEYQEWYWWKVLRWEFNEPLKQSEKVSDKE